MKGNKFFWILSLIFLLALSIVSAVDVNVSNAVESWSHNDNSAPLASDGTGNTTAVNLGAVRTLVSGSNYAYDYDGTDSLNISGVASELDTQSLGSFSVWVKSDEADCSNMDPVFGTIAGFRGSLANDRMRLTCDGSGTNTWTYVYRDDNLGTDTINSDNVINTSWTHLVITFDGTTTRMYVNGVVQTDTMSKGWTDDWADVTKVELGRHPRYNQYEWDGLIDQFMMFDRALNSSEILALYDNGNQGFDPYAPPPVSNFTIVVTDDWSGNDVNNVSALVDRGFCYQETANVSTSCGGLSTGGYTYDSVGVGNDLEDYFDGNYNTYSHFISGDYNIYYYSNYSIPLGAYNPYWYVKHGVDGGADTTNNLSINSDCVVGDTLYLRHQMNDSLTDNFAGSYQCKNISSGSWITLHTHTTSATAAGRYYEESVYWNSSLFTNSTGNTLYTDIPVNTTELFNFSISGQNYFSKNYFDVNVSSDLSATLHQSEINFSVYELGTNNLLSVDNCTIGVLTQSCSSLFNLSAGSYNVTVKKSGYFDLTQEVSVAILDNKTLNITGMSNSIINITPLAISDNSSINVFSGWVYDVTNSINNSFSSTSGYVEIPSLNNTLYNYKISPSGYASDTGSFTTNDTIFNYSTYHYLFNSVNIIVKDVNNDSVINWTTITINTIYDNTSFANTTNDGTFSLSLLTPNDYELRFVASGYVTTSRFVTVLNDSTQQLIIYMDANTTQSQTLRVIDIGSNRVAGAIITIQKEVLNSTDLWLSVGQVETDSEGQAIAFLEKDPTVFYRFSVSLDGEPLTIGSGGGLLGQTSTGGGLFTVKTSFISGINEIVQIVVVTEESDETALTELQGIDYNVTYGVNDSSVLFDFVDARSVIVGGQLLIWGRYLNTTSPYEVVSNQSVLSSSGSISYVFPVVNNTDYLVQAFILFQTSSSLVHERNVLFDIDLLINRGTGLLIGIVLLAFVAVLTYSFGPLISGSLFVGSMFGLAKFGLVNISNGLITTLLAIVIILFVRMRGNR